MKINSAREMMTSSRAGDGSHQSSDITSHHRFILLDTARERQRNELAAIGKLGAAVEMRKEKITREACKGRD